MDGQRPIEQEPFLCPSTLRSIPHHAMPSNALHGLSNEPTVIGLRLRQATTPIAANFTSNRETLSIDSMPLDTSGQCCPQGVLFLRAAHGFAYNIIFANQILLFQSYVGVGQNDAQTLAKLLNALCSITPMIVPIFMGQMLIPLRVQALVGCYFKTLALAMLASFAISNHGLLVQSRIVLCGLFVFYPLGLGAVLSSLPAVAVLNVPKNERTQFMHRFYVYLTVGAIVGIIVSGIAWVVDCYTQSFVVAFVIYLMGVWAFASPPRVVSAPANTAKDDGPQNRLSLWPLLFLVPFYGAYLQWTTSWFILASYANCNMVGFLIPASFLQAVERVAAMCALMLGQTDVGKRWLSRMHVRMKLSVGCCIAGLALLLSACTELLRRDAPRLDAHPDVSSMSVLWLLPQHCCIAVAEALIFPTQTEWASGSPVFLGMGVAVQAGAAAVLALTLPYLESWVPQSSPNDGHYEYFFLMLSVGCLVSAGLFAYSPASIWSASPHPDSGEGNMDSM